MPPKDSATEMIYKILDNMSGIGVNYDAKTNTITYTEPKTTIYDKVTTVDNCYVSCATEHKCNQCENWKEKEEEVKMKNETKPAPVYSPFVVRSVLSNRKKNAFSVVWMDGTTTVVHCQAGDEWDDEKALAMCFTKKALGNKGNFNDKFNNALDNKMKIIPGGAGIKMTDSSISFTRPITLNDEAVKKICDCDPPCTECKCKEESEVDKALAKEFVKKSIEKGNTFGINKQTADELSKAANKASNSLKEMIDALTGESEKEKSEPQHVYKVYTRIGNNSYFDGNYFSIESLRNRVHELAEAIYGRKPYYYRTWMADGRMQIDYGSYSQFIEVEGITPDEYAKI